jgi:hypothetical protein
MSPSAVARVTRMAAFRACTGIPTIAGCALTGALRRAPIWISVLVQWFRKPCILGLVPFAL